MAFDQSTRNRLQKFVSSARAILSEEFTRQLQATYGLDPKLGTNAPIKSLTHLDNRERQTAHLLRETLAHYLATTPGKTEKDRIKQVLDRIVREQAFTVLNRLAALRMAEARGFLLESIAKAHSSKGFQLYRQLSGTAHGETGDAYKNYLFSLFDEFSLDLAVLFDRHSAQGRLFPRESALLELLGEINHVDIEHLWAEDETIGWIYQYFNSQEERKKMRAESQAPRNSRELAVRNQFFTPRYVVEFLTDNTLGRIWYEMTQGNTGLVDSCRYLVRRPTEIFLKPGEDAPETEQNDEALSQQELLQQPVYIPHRPLKDPRTIRMLDPACGSMHFGLYAFDLFERIYLEAWQLEQQLGAVAFTRDDGLASLQEAYASLDVFKQQIPKLIIEHNIHGVDIDPRAVQIAGLSLWQRAQRAWHQQGIKPQQRPTIVKSNIVCAEPMPGEKALLQEFTSKLNPPVLGQLLEVIFDKMQLAGEAGTLLKIEEEIQTAIQEARKQWLKQSGGRGTSDLFQAELDAAIPQTTLGFDLRGINDESFWDDAELRILQALSDYAEQAEATADQKRLFAEDAAKGFAFIDLCGKRFDVVLMNPPFGELASSTATYGKRYYPEGKDDIGTCFVIRGTNVLTSDGKLGAITNRTYFSIPTASAWRDGYLLNDGMYLSVMADLGYGVLDDAMVEAASYIIARGSKGHQKSTFFNLLECKNKEHSLTEYFSLDGKYPLWLDVETFRNFPGSVICHWLPIRFLRNLESFTALSVDFGDIKTGLNTGDDFRFLRLIWEVSPEEIGRNKGRWELLSKGGEYSPFADDFHLVLNWQAVLNEMSHLSGARIFNRDLAFDMGVVYPMRTTSDVSPRALPRNVIFNKASQFLPVSDLELAKTFVVLAYTRPFKILVEALYGSGDTSVSGSAARNYTGGVLNALPIPQFSDTLKRRFAEIYDQITLYLSELKRIEETSLLFEPNMLLSKSKGLGLDSAYELIIDLIGTARLNIGKLAYEADVLASNAYGFEEEDLRENWGVHPYSGKQNERDLERIEKAVDDAITSESENLNPLIGTRRVVTKKSYFSWRELEVACHLSLASADEVFKLLRRNKTLKDSVLLDVSGSVVSVLVGLLFGRWKRSLETSNLNFEDYSIEKIKSDLKGENTVYECNQLAGRIEELANLRGVESFLQEHLHKAGMKDTFEYINNTKGLFEFHLKKYSGSRRQAPIYWPLQTPSGSYTLWVYYHRLNEQTLYTCVNDFVEPKLAQVELDLNSIRSKSARSTQEEKELEKLSDLAVELRDFRDELLRIAKFWKPNLNDGVQITAAPLWKLFQHKAWQKKLKETWESLEQGEYDWAHLACSIWPDRVLRKCHQDRSLAIAHDVEGHFWYEVEVPVTRGKKATGETKFEWQPKDLSESELTALVKRLAAQVNS